MPEVETVSATQTRTHTLGERVGPVWPIVTTVVGLLVMGGYQFAAINGQILNNHADTLDKIQDLKVENAATIKELQRRADQADRDRRDDEAKIAYLEGLVKVKQK